jgi:hypothetical protein
MEEPEMPYPPGAILRRRFQRGTFYHYGIASEYYHPDTQLQLIYQFGGVYEGELVDNSWTSRFLNRVWRPNLDEGISSHTGTRVGLTDYIRFSEGRRIEIVDIPEEPIPVLERAKEMLHRNDYNVLTRNCEHYANYALHGTWASPQSKLSVKKVAEGFSLIVASIFGRKGV